jgi:outer membrane lipoprotein LolB
MRVVSICILVAGALLNGCSTTPPRITTPTVVTDAAAANAWEAQGRLAVSGPAGGGSGSFDWTQRDSLSTLAIRGPVGIGSMRMTLDTAGSDARIQLETGRGKLQSQDAIAELEARLGAPLPVTQMRYWLRGVAAPGEHTWRNEGSDPATLEQDGWVIDYSKYSAAAGPRLPMAIKAVNSGTRVRVVIDRWQINR